KRAKNEQEILRITKNVAGRTNWDKCITKVLSPKGNYHVVNEIMRPAFYGKTWDKKREGKLILITTTSDSAYKGFEVILKTAIILKQSGLPFEWRVAGLNPDTKNVKIAEKWLKIKSDNISINFLGILDSDKLVDNLLQSDIYIQVSHIENSPNSIRLRIINFIPSKSFVCNFMINLLFLVSRWSGLHFLRLFTLKVYHIDLRT
ncbi:MAG: glycosyltransferase, partial [Geopsychrobacter sp.]|nr:glycosyltransferase [Geopsychrobacter sp.]